MHETEITVVQPETLHELIKNKLIKAGLSDVYAEETARHLVFADASGIHSHGAVRVDYYAERIAKGGVTLNPEITFEKKGPSTGIVHGDNGMGQYVCNEALNYALEMVEESGLAFVGISRTGHSGALSYYVKKAAQKGYVALSMCQSDPMVVPFGRKENNTVLETNRCYFNRWVGCDLDLSHSLNAHLSDY